MSYRSNPFSTRFTRPGAIPFLFDEPLSARLIISRFGASQWLAQIVGPHGSGKTTLVRTLEPELRTQFSNIRYLNIRKVWNRIVVESKFSESVRIHEKTNSTLGLSPSWSGMDKGQAITEFVFPGSPCDPTSLPDLLVVDGVESLPRLQRWLLKAWCHKTRTGLLATVHQPSQWLPTIVTIRPEVGKFMDVCHWLQRSSPGGLDNRACARAIKIANGNFREALMLLYDQYDIERNRLRKLV